jgi:hypothetical protein
VDADLTAEHLDVYETREGTWNPEHGEVEIPDGWEFLASGEAFVTRTVKAAGAYWLAWRPRSRTVRHRRLIGLWAPAEAIAAARTSGDETADKRAKARISGARQRERQEERYASEFRAAVIAYLDFTHEHAALAEQIADDATARAAVVGSGRVGRTRTIPLEERAALAARACIRHQHTTYEDVLDNAAFRDGWDAEYLYRDIKAAAQRAVDLFLAAHRHA